MKNTMHINAVNVNGVWVSFDIESINERLAIVGTFTKNGEKIGNDCYVFGYSFEDAIKFKDNDFAKSKAVECMKRWVD